PPFCLARLRARLFYLTRFCPPPFCLTWLHVAWFHVARFRVARFGRVFGQRGDDLGAVDVGLAVVSLRGSPRWGRDDPGVGRAGTFARRAGLVEIGRASCRERV